MNATSGAHWEPVALPDLRDGDKVRITTVEEFVFKADFSGIPDTIHGVPRAHHPAPTFKRTLARWVTP
jgi:hypothetical protein